MFESPVDVVAADDADAPLDFNGDGNGDLVMAQNGFQNNFTSILLGNSEGDMVVSD